MSTTLTGKGQATTSKRIRDGSPAKTDRLAAARGSVDIKWRTDDLMALPRDHGTLETACFRFLVT